MDKIDLLSIIKSKHRVHSQLPYFDDRYAHHFPYFGVGTIDLMLRDSRVRFALSLIKGPIIAYTRFFSQEDADDPAINQAIIDREYNYSFKVESENADTEKFVVDTLNRFWSEGVLKALLAIEWGYSPAQVVYQRDGKGKIQYQGLLNYTIKDCRPVRKGLDMTGILIRSMDKYIPFPKAFIHVHQREYNRYTGRSRLADIHVPWHETWNLGGARDVRKTWYFKNAYDSGTCYVPVETVVDQDGNEKSSFEIAIEVLEAGRTGSYRVFPKPPNSGSGKNERTYDYEPPKANTTPDGMREYLLDLRSEILEGLGIPPEIVESDNSSGMGSATGRKIPLMAFLANITPIVYELLADVQFQIIKPLLMVNKMDPEYTVTKIIPKTFIPGGPDDPMVKIDQESQSDTTVK
jgi:hypothetical protein